MVYYSNWLLWSEGLCFPKGHVEILTSKHDGSRRQGFWEVLTSWGGALVGGLVLCYSKSPQRDLTSPHVEDTARRWPSASTSRGSLTSTRARWHPRLTFPASRPVRNTFLVTAAQSVGFGYSLLNGLKHWPSVGILVIKGHMLDFLCIVLWISPVFQLLQSFLFCSSESRNVIKNS